MLESVSAEVGNRLRYEETLQTVTAFEGRRTDGLEL